MFSATDIASFLACPHTATLDRAESRKQVRRPFFENPTVELLQNLGLEHEQRYLHQLVERDGRSVVTIELDGSWENAAKTTLEAMRRGADAVYQATFFEAPWRGRSDFLLRVDNPSAFGSWSYEVVETKLARSTKAGAIVQLCFYSDLVSRIQGTEPKWMHVVLGGGALPERFSVQHYLAYFRKVRTEFETSWKLESETYPEPVEHCDICSWFPLCRERWRKDDYLSLVAGITRHQRKQLVTRGITTVASLAGLSLPVRPKFERIGDGAVARIHDQAALQLRGREAGHVLYELLHNEEPEKGLGALPQPSPADVFLDLESDPYVLDDGLEYLIGMVTVQENSRAEVQYEPLWSLTRAQEKRNFEIFVGKILQRRREQPDMHIYHYAPYERTAIKRLAARHGTCIDEVDELLWSGVLVDLYSVVRQGLRASVESYSIKSLEPLYAFSRSVPLREANVALAAFETVLGLGGSQQEILGPLGTIQGYNRDDCVSAYLLRHWLEERRNDLERTNGRALPRPKPQSDKAGEEVAAHIREVRTLMARLVANLPEDDTNWTPEHRANWLLAHMLEWHRREDKAAWWEYFRLRDLSDEELQEDKNGMGGLVYSGEVGRVKQSIVHRYSFAPQDHTIGLGSDIRDPRTEAGVGTIINIDERNRTIDIKRSASSEIPHPTALVPFEIIGTNAMRDSLFRLGSWVADHGIAGTGPFQTARELLLRGKPPALKRPIGPPIGNDRRLTEAAKSVVLRLALEPSVLPIQGPPGTGKTFTGARMIVELVKQGRRVGITAVSHKVISNLLLEVCKTASENSLSLKAVQKAKEEDQCEHSMVTQAKNNGAVAAALASGKASVAAGTVWLWAREEMTSSVDVLFVDEAGQMSLANALAISQAATSVVLLGDPQQLDQPQRGIHPNGADVSALGHLLDGRATIGPDRGLFLEKTLRLHPAICAFTSELFYDGRLQPRPENETQRLNTQSPLDGVGLRFAPVEHSMNQNESPEEAEKIVELIDTLLGSEATWTNKNGETRTLRIEDILVVAPYNAQVAALASRLRAGARVGTVDKFQGQEAPIVFYSMATSTPDDAPRGMEFLYSLNRLNVAVSRARCVAVLVACPDLFQVHCKTPRQIELANAFCRYLEMADLI